MVSKTQIRGNKLTRAYGTLKLYKENVINLNLVCPSTSKRSRVVLERFYLDLLDVLVKNNFELLPDRPKIKSEDNTKIMGTIANNCHKCGADAVCYVLKNSKLLCEDCYNG